MLEEIVDRLGDGVVLGHGRPLCTEPFLQAGGQRRGKLLPCSQARFGAEAVDPALNIEERIDPLHRLQRDRRYLVSGFALPHIPRDVCEFEELPPRMRPAERARHRGRLPVLSVEIIIPAIGVRLQDAGPSLQVFIRMPHLPVGGEAEDRGGRRAA